METRTELTFDALVFNFKELDELDRAGSGCLKLFVWDWNAAVVSSGAPAVRHGPHVRLAPQVAVVGADAAPDVHPAVAGVGDVDHLVGSGARSNKLFSHAVFHPT